MTFFYKKTFLKGFCCLALFIILESGRAKENELSRPFALNKALIQRIKKRGGGFVSDSVGKYLLRAVAMANDKKYNSAIELLEWHYNQGRMSPTEKAKLTLYIARFYRQNKNYKKSTFWLNKALSLEALALPDHLNVLFGLVQSYAQEEDYNKAMRYLKLWFSLNLKPAPAGYILLARCYYGKNLIPQALKYAEQALSLIDRPKESWLLFVSSLHIKKEDYKKALPYLESLVALYPKQASHWKQLAGVYLHLEQYDNALVTLGLMDKMGHLKDKIGFLNLASLLIQKGQPYQAGELLRRQIKLGLVPSEKSHWELTATAYWLAREPKSALLHLKQAAKTAVKAEFFLRYGQMLLDQELWNEAEGAFKKALNTQTIQAFILAQQALQKQIKAKGQAHINKKWTYDIKFLTEPEGSYPKAKSHTKTSLLQDPSLVKKSLYTLPDEAHSEKIKAGEKSSLLSDNPLQKPQAQLNSIRCKSSCLFDNTLKKTSLGAKGDFYPFLSDDPLQKPQAQLSQCNYGYEIECSLGNPLQKPQTQPISLSDSQEQVFDSQEQASQTEAVKTASQTEAESGAKSGSNLKELEGHPQQSQTTELKNKLINIYFGLGVSVYKQKQADLALLWFKKIVETDPAFLPAYEWIDQIEETILKNQETGPTPLQ